MDGYIQALINVHYRRLGKLKDNQKYLTDIEIGFIEELESILDYYQNKKELLRTPPSNSK